MDDVNTCKKEVSVVWVFRTDTSAVSDSTLNQFIGLVFVVLKCSYCWLSVVAKDETGSEEEEALYEISHKKPTS